MPVTLPGSTSALLVIIYAGNGYRGNGHEFVRINLACPKELVIDGMQRLKQGVLNLNN